MDEIELKLQLTEAAAAKLRSSDALPGKPRPVAQRSFYFDTPDQALRAAGLSLRIREANGERVQTIKQSDGTAAGFHARPEWQMQVDGDQPVLDGSTPAAKALAGKAASLAPVFAVLVNRETWVLTEGEARIEAVIDEGEVIAADRTSRFWECELELLAGPRDALFIVARRLAAAAPVTLSVQTKSERGFRLIGPQPLACKAEPVFLAPDLTTAEAFRRIAEACLRHFRLNEDLLLATRGAEPLHQARVALRRLRSAFSIFRPMLDPSRQGLRDELKWLAGTLDATRNLDVLASRAAETSLAAELRLARAAAYDQAAQGLQSQRTRSLMLDLAEWIGSGPWTSAPAGQAIRDMPARDFASRALEKSRRKVKKDGRNLSGLSDEARHDLRKDAKKLRYATDFFASLFDRDRPKRLARFAGALADLQDHLGELNDLSAAPAVLQRLGLSDHPDSGFLVPPGSRKALMQAAVKAHGDLLRAKPYWT